MSFYIDIEKETLANKDYRRVLYTGKMQLVLMSINPLEDIPLEKHNNIDQFIRIESGKGKLILPDNNDEKILKDGISVIIKAGTRHRIINTSNKEDLKLYSIYTPAEHPPRLVQKNKPLKNINMELNKIFYFLFY